MKLRRIEVRDFRKLGHVDLGPLGDGLNVIVGNNEAGKSTLLAALRAALFERHRVGGAAALAMQPYGQTVRPEVRLEFERGGVDWTLHKAFYQRQEAELSGGGRRWTGDAVEEQLAEMFGFTPPGRGESKPDEHHGVFGLLWVEQGTSHRALGVGAGRSHLASALEREVGQVTGGERGRRLLAIAEARKAEYWDKRGNPRDRFKAAGAALAEAKEAETTIRRRLAEIEGKVELLAVFDQRLDRHRRNDTHRLAEENLARAEKAAAAVDAHRAALGAAESALERARSRHEAADGKGQARRRLVAEVGRLADEEAAAATSAGEARGQLDRLAQFAAEVRERAEMARVREGACRDEAAAIERALSRRQARESVARLQETLASIEATDAARRDAQAEIDAARLTQADLDRLEGLQKALDLAALRLETSSVRISLEPDRDQIARIDGSAEAVGGELTLSRDTVLHLDGFGRIHVRPGGGVAELSRAAETAKGALEAELRRLGPPDLAAARAEVRRTADIRIALRAHIETLKAQAPKGIDAIRQELARHMLLAGGDDAAEPAVADGALEAARRRAADALAESSRLEGEAKSAEAVSEGARGTHLVLAERASAARLSHQRKHEELLAARQNAPDAALDEAVAIEAAALSEARQSWEAARDRVAAADPETISLSLDQARAAARAIAGDIEELKRKRSDIDIELRVLGKDGLGEELEELTGRIERLGVEFAAMSLEAEAARLLADTLSEAQRETREMWLAPVRERSSPYLRLIQPDSRVVLDDASFEIDRIERNGVSEPFGGLSVGAREQIAVITRLALADILRDAGQESCVVLDDALVNADEDRLARMHLVLHKAAQHQQILILTCRERDFLQLGAPILRM